VTRAYIELNDAGILQAVNGDVINTSPAYAVMDKNTLLLGKEAQNNARLLPTWTNNRFWNQLSSDPIANSTHNIRHHADLAFAHLEHIWQGLSKQTDQVVIGVPGFYDQHQLGLLLGMAKEANIPVVGMVDSALAAIASETSHASLLHLEISLHRITLTQFQIDDQVKKVNHINVAETGLITLWDRWASVVAQQFIQSSRFDPMYDAKSEQALFDRLPNWISGDNNTFEMDIDGLKHSVQVPEDQLIHVGDAVYPKIAQAIVNLSDSSGRTSILVSHLFDGFPGLNKTLGSIEGVDFQYLNNRTAAKTIHMHWDNIVSSDGAVAHITELPRGTKKTIEVNHAASPTHLLLDHRATQIGKRLTIVDMNHSGIAEEAEGKNPAFTIVLSNGHHLLQSQTQELRLNGKLVPLPAQLKIGDEISLHDRTATLIEVS
jgi:hypothetical protein